MKELVLGTVQLGMAYGINNKIGSISEIEAFKILQKAYDSDIQILDTAAAYGKSEEVIGKFMNKYDARFKIMSKLPKINEIPTMMKYIDKSLENLGIGCIDYYLLHNFDDVKNVNIINFLIELKKKEKIKEIGVSIYNPEDLEYINSNLKGVVDIVQIPFNLLDLRWLKKDILKVTKENNIKIAVRSIFLQGFIFLDSEKAKEIYPNGDKYITEIEKIAQNSNMQIDELAIEFIKYIDEIDQILIGCESVEQLTENLKLYQQPNKLNKEIYNEILSKFSYVEKEIIDPRLWK